ncbi:MAG: hypothetical protein NTX62_04815, partial [Deltaproteobacteria bacterium]|nr:hypothetical protein [Deltaproteobacteria bacterium]
MDILSFKVTLAIYFISALGYLTSLYVRRVLVAKIATWVLTVAFINHTIFFIFRYAGTGQIPI